MCFIIIALYISIGYVETYNMHFNWEDNSIIIDNNNGICNYDIKTSIIELIPFKRNARYGSKPSQIVSWPSNGKKLIKIINLSDCYRTNQKSSRYLAINNKCQSPSIQCI